MARAQKLSFRAVERAGENQIVGRTKVKREREADNFCLRREWEWIVAKPGGPVGFDLRNPDTPSK